jgi:transcription elongation GreA/GreB family factor
MRLPIRKSQLLKPQDDEDIVLLTPGAVERLKRELEDLEKVQKPKAIEDVSRSVQMGDLSENAEYREAKPRLSRIESRIFTIKDRLKRVVLIQNDQTGRAGLGTTVVVEVNGARKTYQIVGPRESNPSQGRISHVSPLGTALTGHYAGESVTIQTPNGESSYLIVDVT